MSRFSEIAQLYDHRLPQLRTQPGLLREREPANGDRHGGAGSRVGIPADERSVAGGGSPELGESDGDPENLDEPDDEELDEMVSDDESDTISVFTDIPEEISPDSDYAKKLLEDEIIRGSGFSYGKFHISEYISENSPSKDELAKFLKNEYGIGGSSRNDDPVSFSNHDGKGIELVLSNKQVIRFNWKKVAEAVRSAVNSGKYITESDIETRRRMTLFDAQRFAIHYEYPHCLYNDRLDYIRKETAACGLDYPIRLNADMFAVYAAECVRTKPHVKESYQKIDRSSIAIPWKFNDWNEAAAAGKNLPVDSGYGQFRAMCRDSVSELINEISAHTGHNPALGFPEEEITEFFVSGEPLTSDSVDKTSRFPRRTWAYFGRPMEYVMEELKFLSAAVMALIFAVSCQNEYDPAAGYSQMYGGAVIYEWRLDAVSLYSLKGIRL